MTTPSEYDEPRGGLLLPTKENLLLARAHEWLRRRAEEWFIETRLELGHSRLAFDVVVLKPVCDDCCTRLGRRSRLERVLAGNSEPRLVVLLPEDPVPERIRLYDGASHCVHFWPPTKPYTESHRVQCSMCGQRVSSMEGDDIINVFEEPFSDHFGFPEDGPRRVRGRAERRRITSLYGSRCFECRVPLGKKDVTLDHVDAKARGGPSISINLQPLCETCNQKKRDLPVTTVKIALDMLLRPAPSDSYDGPVW
jgi:HNH endonuclease